MATVRKLESGKWQGVVRRKGHGPVFKSFLSRANAEQWTRLLESEMDRGCFLDRTEAERTTIGALIDRYLVEVTPTKRSAQSNTSCLQGLKRQFGSLAVSALHARHIAAYRDERISMGKAGGTVIHEMNALSHVIDTAIREWSLPLTSNPVKLVRKPKPARGRNRRLEAGEEQRLIHACKASRSGFMLVPLVQLALETAMRLGELLSLEWPSIDLQKRVATLSLTKNGDERDVPLSTIAIEVLSHLPRNIADPRVFWMWKRVDSVEHVWQRAVKRAALANLRFHDMRHEAISRLFERGLHAMEVAAISGHRTLAMLSRYTHLRAESLEPVMDLYFEGRYGT